MKTISLVIVALILAPSLASAGVKSAEFVLPAVKASALSASGEAKTPVPPVPAKEEKSHVYRSVRLCSYMFTGQPGGADGLGVFAFDMNRAGQVCEIPFFHGHPYGAYQCDGAGNATASTDAGEIALLFKDSRADGSSLYHRLNVPADFARQAKFRGRMKISGKPPKDLSKPLGKNGGGVYSLSCKKAVVAFEAE